MPVLSTYVSNTQNLLQLPGAATTLYPTTNVENWVNIARGQLAGESESIRYLATVSCVVGQRNYNFSALNTGVSGTNGIQGAIHVRRISYGLGTGQQWIPGRAWEWFDLYNLNNVNPTNGPPAVWAQYAQGAGGSFYIDPPPDYTYTLYCDVVCYPITLVDDTSVEAIPYLWTDAVPFFAAYYALLSSQTSARQADAERMFKHYTTFVERARTASNPSVLRWQYEQAGDPTQGNKIALARPRGAA